MVIFGHELGAFSNLNFPEIAVDLVCHMLSPNKHSRKCFLNNVQIAMLAKCGALNCSRNFRKMALVYVKLAVLAALFICLERK